MTAAALPTDVSDQQPDRRRWIALAVLALVQFMLILDVTVVNVALNVIKTDLGFTQSSLTWVVDGYVLTAGGLLLLGGRLADLLGRRRMFLVGIGLFTVASALSGAAQNPGMLIASRFLQGAGEAIAAPAAFGLVVLLFTNPKERATAVGVFGGMAGLGGTFGPIISGLLIQASWRWIFFVNLPVAAFAMIAVVRLVDESRADRRVAEGRPDVTGAVLITAGLSGVVYGLIEAATHPWGSTRVLVPLLVGIGLIVAFVFVEATVKEPLVPLRFFTNRTRVTANVVTMFFASVFFTMFFLLTLYFEQVQGYSALRTGVAYLPFGIVIAIAIGMSGVLVPKFGVKPLLVVGFVFYTIGMLLLTRITPAGHYWSEPFPALVLTAFGSGLAFAGFVNASVHGVSQQDASLASGVQNAVQQIGGAVGLAVLATIALRHFASATKNNVDAGTAATDGYIIAFRIGAIVMAVGAVLVFLLFEKVSVMNAAMDGAAPVPAGPEASAAPAFAERDIESGLAEP